MTTRAYAIAAFAALALVAGAFLAGRWTAPTPTASVEYLERLRTVTVTKYVDRVVVKTKHTVEVVTKDGDKTTTTDETERDAQQTVERPAPAKDVAKLVPGYTPPNNHVAIGAGLTFASGYSTQYTFSYERRILGPVWIGAEVTSQPAGYLRLGVDF